MELTFLVPSAARTIGGVIALYEFANGMSRRGHHVHLVHVPVIRGHISALNEVDWFRFDSRIEHHLVAAFDEMVLPPADFVELTALSFFADAWPADASERVTSAAGLPFLFVQALRFLPPHIEDAAIHTPGPKLCVAQWMMRALRKEGVPEEELAFMRYGLDHGTYRLERPIAERPRQVAMLYNVHPAKGAQYGLQAIVEVQRRLPDTRAVVFGNQEPLVEIPHGITYVQSPSRDTLVNDIYNGSAVFLCSSIREGFGLCAIEAMAGGCALVTTANGGCEEYAIPGQTALVCQPRDSAGMADRIQRLLDDEAMRVRIATAGRRFVQDEFDWDRSALQLERYLESYAANAPWSNAT